MLAVGRRRCATFFQALQLNGKDLVALASYRSRRATPAIQGTPGFRSQTVEDYRWRLAKQGKDAAIEKPLRRCFTGQRILRLAGRLSNPTANAMQGSRSSKQFARPFELALLTDRRGERRSVNPWDQPSDFRGIPTVVGKLLSQPALFATRFGLEEHCLD